MEHQKFVFIRHYLQTLYWAKKALAYYEPLQITDEENVIALDLDRKKLARHIMNAK